MKKLISILVCAVIMCTILVPPVLAEDSANITFKPENGKYAVTMSGTYSVDGRVLIVVKDSEGNIAGLEQCDVKNGVFALNFSMKVPTVADVDYLQYTALVGHSSLGSGITVPFNLPTADYYTRAVERLKTETSASEICSIVNQTAKFLGLDVTYFTEENQIKIANNFIGGNRSSLTEETLPGYFNECIIRTYIYDLKTDVENVLKHYEATLSVINDENSFYPEYDKMSKENKSDVLSILSRKEVELLSDIRDVFNMAVVSVNFKNGENSAVVEMLLNHTTYLGIEGFEKLNSTKQVKVVNKIKELSVPEKANEFSKTYDEALEIVNTPAKEPSAPSGGGGSAGGGGSTGAGSIGVGQHTTPEKDTKPEETPAPQPEKTDVFTDISGYQWAHEAINALVKKGVLSGKSKGVFAPGDLLTREEFAKIISLAFDIYDKNATVHFNDVESARWSNAYIASIYKFGITSGYPDGSFGCEKAITREELATMLYRTLSNKYKIFTTGEIKSNFNDLENVSDYAKSAVLTLEHNKIITGDDKGSFNPQNNATRAECCVMVYRAMMQTGGETNEN